MEKAQQKLDFFDSLSSPIGGAKCRLRRQARQISICIMDRELFMVYFNLRIYNPFKMKGGEET